MNNLGLKMPPPPNEEQDDKLKALLSSEEEALLLRTQRSRYKTTLIGSFRYAFQGIWYVVRTQRNMQIHVGLGMVLLVFAFLFKITTVEWAILLGMMGLVYALEILNTAIEAVVDMVTRQYHPLAKVAKDAAAGAVLIAALFAVGVALCIFLPRFLHFLFG